MAVLKLQPGKFWEFSKVCLSFLTLPVSVSRDWKLGGLCFGGLCFGGLCFGS